MRPLCLAVALLILTACDAGEGGTSSSAGETTDARGEPGGSSPHTCEGIEIVIYREAPRNELIALGTEVAEASRQTISCWAGTRELYCVPEEDGCSLETEEQAEPLLNIIRPLLAADDTTSLRPCACRAY